VTLVRTDASEEQTSEKSVLKMETRRHISEDGALLGSSLFRQKRLNPEVTDFCDIKFNLSTATEI
jgi:hypothetical protein